MDSISHVRVAHLLLGYIEQSCGVTFDESAFVYGNLKPDLTGTYLSKRHYPSLWMDDVMEKLRVFIETYSIGARNGYDLSVDLGEICHFMTDFFCFPHNDDIYDRNLLAHYVYEKRIALSIRRKLTEEKFERWASPIVPALTEQALLSRIEHMHEQYRNQKRRHCIDDDLVHVCRITATVVLSVVNICYERAEVSAAITA